MGDETSINFGFFDLDPEDRAYWYERALEETGQAFFDLPPEERGRYYERAAGYYE